MELELAKIHNRLFADKRDAISLQAVGDNYHEDYHKTAMKEIKMETFKNTNGNEYTVTLNNDWRSMPSVRSLDVMAIRFGAVNGLTVYKAEETWAKQIWNGNVIKYSSTSDKFHYKTSGSVDGKAGVGVTMNLKDDASSLSCMLQVRYSASALYAYSIYGAYEHATSAVSDTSYTFSPTGMGGVIQFNKNASIYDNTTGLSVLADR